MRKFIKIIVILVLLGIVGFFAYDKLGNKDRTDSQDLEAMKQSIIAESQAGASDLTDEQKEKFLAQLKEAQKIVVNTNFDNLQSINDVARLKKLLGDIDGAIIAWEYANIIRPQNSLSFSNLATLYHFDLKQYDKAEKNYLISIANDPDDINTIRNLFEMYFYATKDNVKAEGLLLASLEDNPESVDLLALLGSFYSDTGNRAKAVEYYKKALALKPGNTAIQKEIERLEK